MLWLFGMMLCIGVTASCTTSSQIPLSVRQQEDRAADVNDTTEYLDRDAIAEVDEETLRQQEEERRERMEQMEEDYQNRTNTALSYFMQAQTEYFNSHYQQALDYIDQALENMETADFYALKGSIYYMIGREDEAIEYWRQAVQKNEEVVGDIYPGLRTWYEQEETP